MIRKLLIVLLLAIVAAIGYALFWRTYLPDNRIPPMALRALENDTNLVLYSLEPERYVVLDSGDTQPLPADMPKFHSYRILGQTPLSTAESRRVVIETVKEAVHHWNGSIAACFEPRHGIRATDASGTYDFLICFTCSQVYVFSPGNAQTELGIRASGKPLNNILTAAHVPLPTR